MFKKAKDFARKCWNKAKKAVVVTAAAVTIGSSAMVEKAHSAAPASLSDALSVTIDQTVVWAAMAGMLGIIGGIAAYYFVKRMIGGR